MLKRLLLPLLSMLPLVTSAQLSALQDKIAATFEGRNLKIGLALRDLTTGDSLNIRSDERFPMQSVFKFPIALAVLQEVDNGVWQLDDSLFVAKRFLPTGTWSPLRDRYPEGDVYLTLADLLRYTVSQSDNNGCDILLRLLGGPSAADSYVRSLGIADIRIEKTEAQMHQGWKVQFSNWATPQALIELLGLFREERLLMPDTQAFLWETMVATSTGSVRTKLPAEAVVAHKTGSSGRSAAGLSAATNDAGILLLPDGRELAYVIFITDSTESDAVNADIIANIASILYTESSTASSHE